MDTNPPRLTLYDAYMGTLCKEGQELTRLVIKDKMEKQYTGTFIEVNYSRLLAAQDNKCALCLEILESRQRKYPIDHDHACCPPNRRCVSCVRGVVHDACNQLIRVVDDYNLLQKAIDYKNKNLLPGQPRLELARHESCDVLQAPIDASDTTSQNP